MEFFIIHYFSQLDISPSSFYFRDRNELIFKHYHYCSFSYFTHTTFMHLLFQFHEQFHKYLAIVSTFFLLLLCRNLEKKFFSLFDVILVIGEIKEFLFYFFLLITVKVQIRTKLSHKSFINQLCFFQFEEKKILNFFFAFNFTIHKREQWKKNYCVFFCNYFFIFFLYLCFIKMNLYKYTKINCYGSQIVFKELKNQETFKLSPLFLSNFIFFLILCYFIKQCVVTTQTLDKFSHDEGERKKISFS